jgi:hypothetical protein
MLGLELHAAATRLAGGGGWCETGTGWRRQFEASQGGEGEP